jgi:hypothetical protein
VETRQEHVVIRNPETWTSSEEYAIRLLFVRTIIGCN